MGGEDAAEAFDIVPDYREDMCPRTPDILSCTVYISANPDDTAEILAEKAELHRKALS